MDGQRFDDLVKQFGTTRLTRVSVIRGLAAGALAAVTGVKAGSERTVEAQGSTCRGEGVICEGGAQVCCANLVCNGLENPTRCRACGGCDHPHDPILPHGIEPTGHAWLHAACWSAWNAARKDEAVAALKAIGTSPAGFPDGFGKNGGA